MEKGNGVQRGMLFDQGARAPASRGMAQGQGFDVGLGSGLGIVVVEGTLLWLRLGIAVVVAT